MGIGALPVVSPGSITDTWDPTTNARGELGQIFFYKNGDQYALVEMIQLDNNGVSQGEVLVNNYATMKAYSVKKAATTDEGAPMRGIAAATIASQKAGYMYIGGWCEKADLSHTAASGEYLMISGSTAGKLTPHRASAFNIGTTVTDASDFMVLAVSRNALATGVGSVQIMSMWG